MTDESGTSKAAVVERGPRPRLAAVEGLRGIAIVLVMISHIWVLAPTQDVLESAFGGFFRSGNFGVSVFLVMAGFFLVYSLQAEIGRTRRVDVKEAILRRWVRISAHVYALVLAMLVATALLPTDTYAPSDTARSMFRIVTYTWNWFAMDEPLFSRPDGGHLWFTSVYLQVTVALVVLAAALARRRLLLSIVLGVLIVTVTIWRQYSYVNDGEWIAFLRTTTRMDGMLWGAFLATVWPWLPKLSASAATALASIAGAGLFVLSFTATDSSYFGAAGVLMCIATAIFIYSASGAAGGPVTWLLSRRPMVALGTWSMALYIWHYPVYWAVSKQTMDWQWMPKTVVAMAIIVVCVAVAQRFVEEPSKRWLEQRRAARPEKTFEEESPSQTLRSR